MKTEEDFLQEERNAFRDAYGAFVACVVIFGVAGLVFLALFGIVKAISLL